MRVFEQSEQISSYEQSLNYALDFGLKACRVSPGFLISVHLNQKELISPCEIMMPRDQLINPCDVPAILAMGTANPEGVLLQSEYPDFFFRITDSEHMVELKNKFKRICEKTGIHQRHLHLTEEILQKHPELCSDAGESSLLTRQQISNTQVAALGAVAANRAIQEWGHSVSEITHLIVATSNGIRIPGADLAIARILGLSPRVRRLMLNQLGCSAGGTALRMAREFALNGDATTRVLVICSEVGAFTFRPPNEKHADRLVGSAVMGDGASAFVVGRRRRGFESEGCFEMHWAGQFFIPDSEDDLTATLTENGLIYFLSKHVPELVSESVTELLPEAISASGKSNLSPNDLFWAVHPGGRAILDQIEAKLSLSKEKLAATRETLADYGNMSSATVLFVLERVRRRSKEMKMGTSGEGCEWGLLISFGPGLTVEMQLLRSVQQQ